jgi:hypothetical protein
MCQVARKGGFGSSTKMDAFATLCTLLGYFRDVPQSNTSHGNSHNDNDELEGNGALDIHLDLPICHIYKQVKFRWD